MFSFVQDSIIQASVEHHINNLDRICLKLLINTGNSSKKWSNTEVCEVATFVKLICIFYDSKGVFKDWSKYEFSNISNKGKDCSEQTESQINTSEFTERCRTRADDNKTLIGLKTSWNNSNNLQTKMYLPALNLCEDKLG